MRRIRITPECPNYIGQKLWLVNAPYTGTLLFKGEPTSLLYAVAPFIEAVRAGDVRGLSAEQVALLNPSTTVDRCREEFEQLLIGQELRAVAISTTTAGCIEARKIAALVKAQHPDAITVLGGPHDDDLDESDKTALHPEFSSFVDFSVAGNGEYLLMELLKLIFEAPEGTSSAEIKDRILRAPSRFQNARGLGGLFFTHRGRPVALKCNSPLRLGDLPLPPRYLLAEEDTKSFDLFMRAGRSVKTAQIMTERSCPFNCSYCSESTKDSTIGAGSKQALFASGANLRPIEQVLSEIRQVLDYAAYAKENYGVKRESYRAIFFDDSTFTHTAGARRSFLRTLLRELQGLRDQFDFEWGCQTRADSLSEDLLHEMVAAGCTYVYVGLESVNNGLLRQMAKGMSNVDLRQAFDMLARVNLAHDGVLRIGLSLLFGVPNLKTDRSEESRETALETLQFVEQLLETGLITLVSPNICVYYPGTLIARHSQRRLDFHYTAGHPPYPGYPWNRFEEGSGYHAANLDSDLAEFIIREGVKRLGEVLTDQDVYNVSDIHDTFWSGELERSETPHAYLNHASIMRPSSETAAARSSFNATANPCAVYESTRDRLASVFGSVESDRICFARNTTEAVSLALWVATQQSGRTLKNVLVTDLDNYSVRRVFRVYADHANADGRYRWSACPNYTDAYYHSSRSGAVPRPLIVDTVSVMDDLPNAEERIVSAAKSSRPDLLVVSHVDRGTGRILDVSRVVRAVRYHCPATLILIDGAKAFGAIPRANVEQIGADFYVAGPHFTFGSFPVGVVCLASDLRDMLRTSPLSLCPEALFSILQGMFAPSLRVPTNSAEGLSTRDLFALQISLDLLTKRGLLVGDDFTQLDAMRGRLKEDFHQRLAKAVPDAVASSVGFEFSNYIYSFRIRRRDNRAIVLDLWNEYQVMVSYIAQRDLIRASFNYDNHPSDCAYAVESIAHSSTFEKAPMRRRVANVHAC